MLATNLLQSLRYDIHSTPEKLAGHTASLAHKIHDLIITTFDDDTVLTEITYVIEEQRAFPLSADSTTPPI